MPLGSQATKDAIVTKLIDKGWKKAKEIRNENITKQISMMEERINMAKYEQAMTKIKSRRG